MIHTVCNNARRVKYPIWKGLDAQMEAMRPLKSDRRILRSQRALREALVAELSSGVDIARVSVAALTERAIWRTSFSSAPMMAMTGAMGLQSSNSIATYSTSTESLGSQLGTGTN